MQKLNFEDSLARLSVISTEMGKSDLPLETSMKLYSEAVGLANDCKSQIESAKLEITRIENLNNVAQAT
jgi:exodeoxyribonuclease VII small subunit